MALELRFTKNDDSSWGFRLIGGADCDIPLTVTKVAENSLAEEAGLQVDDIVVRIEETATSGLTHLEAHDVLKAVGNDFIMAIRRGENIDVIKEDEMNNQEVCAIMENSRDQSVCTKIESNREETCSIEIERALSPSKSSITDEQIAEAISAEAEVLPDQNVLGVNFNKIDLSESTVLKVLEQQKEEEKNDLSNKKWSTFLQKPQRPVVIPKKSEPEGQKSAPYRPLIIKQKKKDVQTTIDATEESSTTEITEDVTDTKTNEDDNIINDEIADEEPQEINNDDDDNESELLPEDQINEVDEFEKVDENDEEEEDQETIEEKQVLEGPSTTSLSLEEQLAQVQQQLEQLAQLPSTVQVTLDAVTQQLAKIVRASSRHVEEDTFVEEAETLSEGSSHRENTADDTDQDFDGIEENQRHEKIEQEENTEEERFESEDISETSGRDSGELLERADQEKLYLDTEIVTEEEMEQQRIEAEKSTKEERLQQMEQHIQRRLEHRPTQPLTPVQRPIILPGGRKWSEPNDAIPQPRKSKMSDEKICETIETYSEIISGRTKG